MLASDVNNPQFVGAQPQDAAVSARFYTRSMKNEFQSEKEGRPIYFEQTFVEIRTPGNNSNIIDTPVREDHKQRFPFQWAVFKNSQLPTDQTFGTPVEEWPVISRSQADELKGVKFFTVEQIALASDLQIQAIGMNGLVLRQKAQAFLAKAKDSAFEQKQAAELIKKDQQIADLTAMVNKLADSVEVLKNQPVIQSQSSTSVNEVKPKRKYTKKIKTEIEPT